MKHVAACSEQISNVDQFQFWQHHNQPIALWSAKVIKQKIDYIHNNPVMSSLVTEPIHYKYSSARNYQDDNSIIEIDDLGFMGQYSVLNTLVSTLVAPDSYRDER